MMEPGNGATAILIIAVVLMLMISALTKDDLFGRMFCIACAVGFFMI